MSESVNPKKFAKKGQFTLDYIFFEVSAIDGWPFKWVACSRRIYVKKCEPKKIR